jgi:hypothetical protein
LSAVYYVDHYIDGQNFMLTSPWTDATVIDGSASYAIPISKVTINELCLIFCKSASVKTELYAPMLGRTFNSDMWSAGTKYNFPRALNDSIADPVDLLEHIKRLGNWSEVGDITKIGKEYAPHAKINTGTGIGGFDYFHLVYIRGCRPSFQILEKSDADIIKLSKDICSTYFLSSYQNENGEECVLPLDKDSYNAMKLLSMRSFTYADLYGDISDIQEPDPQNIYCQPVINYNYNYASDKYSMMLGVINASAPAFNRSCVVGFSTDDDALAQELWQYCHDFYLEFGNIETPSGDLTDKKMIRSYADATWYLKTWIWWMKTHRRRFELITNYERGIGLYPGMLVNVNLKHQTHGNDKICRVEKVGLSLHKNTATLGLIMIDE